jgi:hypothetical protein
MHFYTYFCYVINNESDPVLEPDSGSVSAGSVCEFGSGKMISARIRIENSVVEKLKGKNVVAVLAAGDGLDEARYPVP